MIIRKFFLFLIINLIKAYQLFLSPLFAPSCRFYPSCSQYAYQAFLSHGILKGLYLTIKRLLKCHPFHQGGIDFVP